MLENSYLIHLRQCTSYIFLNLLLLFDFLPFFCVLHFIWYSFFIWLHLPPNYTHYHILSITHHTNIHSFWTIVYECLSPRKKTTIEEQWDQQGAFELISVEQETYEKYFYGTEHWNYFTSDEDLGPVILSIKQETINGRDQFRILVRAGSYTVHGLIPASCVFADR